MSIFNFPLIYRELWACFEFFRKCGFPSEEIFVAITNDGLVQCSINHNGKEAAINVGRIVDCDREKETARWLELCELVNNGSIPESELAVVWEASMIKKNAPEILLKLNIIGCSDSFIEAEYNRIQTKFSSDLN